MADNVTITPGSGATVRAVQKSGIDTQVVIEDIGGAGAEVLAAGTASGAKYVNLRDNSGNEIATSAHPVRTDPTGSTAQPITDNGGSVTVDDGGASLTVDAPANAPLAIRPSDGSGFIAALPVSGEVTADQGAPASLPNAWGVKITDGTNTAPLDSSNGNALKVSVVADVGTSGSIDDGSTFTEGSTPVVPIAGEYNTAPGALTSGQVGAAQVTQNRAIHINLRKADGTELGISAAPLRTDPTGSTKQPVSLNDSSGNPISDTNPLPVIPASSGRTRITNSVSLAASQTAQAVVTPSSGKKFVIVYATLVVSVAGALKLFDGTDTAANRLFDGTWPTGVFNFNFADFPWKSSTVDNLLNYTSGTGMTAVITLHGYEV